LAGFFFFVVVVFVLAVVATLVCAAGAASSPPIPARTSSTATVTPAPNQWVTGANGRLSASTDVCAIMLTPSGTLSRSETNGFAPWKITRSPWAIRNRKKSWSSSLADSTRPFGLTHSRQSTKRLRTR
jgi:hypothetical protein